MDVVYVFRLYQCRIPSGRVQNIRKIVFDASIPNTFQIVSMITIVRRGKAYYAGEYNKVCQSPARPFMTAL